MNIFIDIHAIQTIPPSNINRDDTGSPKSAIYGGVQRQRVSSQAWKRAIRKDFPNYIDLENLGNRTRRIGDLVHKAALEINPDTNNDQLQKALIDSFSSLKWNLEMPSKDEAESESENLLFARSPYLAFFSKKQIHTLALKLLELDPGKKLTKKELNEILDTEQSIDIALFGRMIADAPDYKVDASAQVAHAISVHESVPEHDYFTAVDDVIESDDKETGAGMIGTVEFTSSTLYRYATVNLNGLEKNIGDKKAAIEAATAFTQAFINSQPAGKQNTFANQTLPELVLVQIRTDRPVSYVNAFENPISSPLNRREETAKALLKEIDNIESGYGFKAQKTFLLGIGEQVELFETNGTRISFERLSETLQNALSSMVE